MTFQTVKKLCLCGLLIGGVPECLLNKEWRNQVDEVVIALPPKAAHRARELAAMLHKPPLEVSFTSTPPALTTPGL